MDKEINLVSAMIKMMFIWKFLFAFGNSISHFMDDVQKDCSVNVEDRQKIF
jgi:hypothetical protein